MKYGARKFSQSSYDNNDELAKTKFKNYIQRVKGHKIVSDKETYDHDIITEKDGDKFFFELEIKRNYPFTNKASFKFPTVSFLGRKERLHNKEPFFYTIVCYETGWAVCCHSDNIYKDEYIEEFEINKHEREGLDCFYRVPKNECYFINLNKKPKHK